jgi:hypothetical protein
LQAGGATCAAKATQEPTNCPPDAGPFWICSAGGDGGQTPAFCNQGFLQNKPVSCNPPQSYCVVTADAGDAICIPDAGVD